MNDHSSRSHVIFTITIERSELGADRQQHVRMGKLHLVDLAVRLHMRDFTLTHTYMHTHTHTHVLDKVILLMQAFVSRNGVPL